MLHSINLSLSSSCGADCIYCPPERSTGIKTKIMKFETAKKIIDQISNQNFLEKHKIRRIELGENGDAFINKDAIDIMKYIKNTLPNIETEIYTNFQNFNHHNIDEVLKNGLIDFIYCNIDGSNKQQYEITKKINFENTFNNILTFIDLRNKYNSSLGLNIKILTYKKYIETINKNFGSYPNKIKSIDKNYFIDDLKNTKKLLKQYINPDIDTIFESDIFGRAERDSFINKEIDYSDLNCPYLYRVEEEAFIAPDGTRYACCFDSKPNIKLGNVLEKSIDDIFESKIRKDFIIKLKEKKFKEIGNPCSTVNCCINLY